jgi:hypothetical protein
MSGRLYTPVDDRSAWKGRDLQKSEDWVTHVEAGHVAELERALASVRARGLRDDQIARADFALPVLGGVLASLAQEIESGRGFALLRGLPVQRWGLADATTIYFGLSSHIGRPVSQNRSGALSMLVQDIGLSAKEFNVRGPQTNARLYFHSDFSDVAALMCMHPAKQGGVSRICSSIALYNALAADKRTDLIDAFYDGFPFDRKGEERPGLPPIAEAPIPMLTYHQGRLSFRYFPGWSDTAVKRTGIPYSAVQRQALDAVNALSNLDEYCLDTHFQVGDVQYVNNYSVLHSRTDFIDFDEPERKRLLVRLWLRAHLGRELPDAFDRLFGPSPTRDGIPVAQAA